MDDEIFALAVEAIDRSHINRAGVASVADDIVEWIDPIAKQTFLVNSRTGVVLPTTSVSISSHPTEVGSGRPESRNAAAINTALTSDGQAITLSRRPRSVARSDDKQWLPGFLKEWNNPVFAPQNEESIAVASIDGPGIDAPEHLESRCRHSGHSHGLPDLFATGTAKLTKAGLRNAQVIRQVDQKFILCKMGNESNGKDDEKLVLVDQHAASERVILEALLAELCSSPDNVSGGATSAVAKVKTQFLLNPLRFQISSIEYQLFTSHTQHFADWGILYDLRIRQPPTSSSQVRPPKEEHLIIVKALPPVIVERSVQLPHLVINLLRSEVYATPPSTKTTPPAPNQDINIGQHAWLTYIGSCLPGLLEMLNSRACRSAVMFNDELELEQCEELMGQLAQCAFPFICAHGRVSMVPLVEFGGDGVGFGGAVDGAESTDGGVFVKWLERRDR